MTAPTPSLAPTYVFGPDLRRAPVAEVVGRLRKLKHVPDDELAVAAEVATHIERLLTSLGSAGVATNRLQTYMSFLPPRLVASCQSSSLIPFFGSGVSIPAGIPSWAGLLDKLGLSSDYLSDPHVDYDALTQAELIAQSIGTDALQQQTLDLTKAATHPTVAHHLLAELRLPVYMTTNYDDLFEEAWRARWNNEEPAVVTNDADVSKWGLDTDTRFPLKNDHGYAVPLLIKLHGDAAGGAPHLILTRSDYRHHYRANSKLFELLKNLMASAAVMFLGFSHRDPEVTRLVDDLVFKFETRQYTLSPRPLFSIQFDMRQRTPEVFAARGIVALRPPASLANLPTSALRSVSVATELAELFIATQDNAHVSIDLEQRLRSALTVIENDVEEAMSILMRVRADVEAKLSDRNALEAVLKPLLASLGARSGQGIYATFDNGDLAGFVVPDGLSRTAREVASFASRPYFRQAQMFRHEFVSDVFESIYNKNSTVFFCVPLGNATHFSGLLFAAAQPGAWETIPLQREACRPSDFIVVDSNGVAVVPATHELVSGDPQSHPASESASGNQGFIYARVHELSRRDRHVAHVVENVVPIGYDDDVHEVSADLRLYSMVAAVKGTRWKMAISTVVPAAVPRPNTAPTAVS